jgi:hypothetical protein
MNVMLKIAWIQLTAAARRILPGMILSVEAATSVFAQGQIATGTISGSGSGPYTYNLTFNDTSAATSPIGSVWYAWVPGFFYLPGVPTSASAPAGWTATIVSDSVQFVASSPATFIQPGQSLSGFSYHSAFSPQQLAAAPNSGRSVAYSGGLFSDAGNTFTVVVAPPSYKITVQLLSGGNVRLSFAGIADAKYALDRSFSLAPPNWLPQVTNTANSSGALVLTNTPSPATNNFWRFRSVP